MTCDASADLLEPSGPLVSSLSTFIIDLKGLEVKLTRSTVQPSSGLSWLPLETLLALFHSNRCSSPWHGKRSRNYTAPEPGRPAAHTSDSHRTETGATAAVIKYLKYTDSSAACLYVGWQTVVDAGAPILCRHRVYLNCSAARSMLCTTTGKQV